MLRHCWNVEIKGEQHNIEIQLDTILGIFGTGGGRLLVDGEIVRDWGCNPFTLIPGERINIEVTDKKSFIRTKGRIIGHLVLVSDAHEIPPTVFKS